MTDEIKRFPAAPRQTGEQPEHALGNWIEAQGPAAERILAESDERDRHQRALSVIGRFSGGPSDVSVNHNKYLAEDFQ